jgi:hypothetical protein
MQEDEKLDGEWLEALEVEAPEDDKSEDDKEEVEDDNNDADTSDDTDSDDSGRGDSEEENGGEGQEAKAEEAEVGAPEEDNSGKNDTKDAIKEALQEIETDKASRASQIDALKKEVTETLYPEGIERQLRDSDGDPITGIDDLTKLVNPKTGELFTDEEAGAWLLSAQQKLNKDIEIVENFIERVAEVNASITENAKRVSAKYGDILAADDALRERLVKAYDKTLVKDPQTGVTISAPVDVVEFFDIALEARVAQQAADQQASAAKAKADAEKAAKAGQADRGDLKPSGKSDNLDPETKEWAEAIKAYEQGV